MTPSFSGISVLLAAVSVESFAQMFLKLGAGRSPNSAASRKTRGDGLIDRLPGRAWITLGVTAYGVEILLYTAALHFLDVSVAFPVGSLCFVGVAILSKFFLRETIGAARWVGIACILIGAIFVTM